MPKNCLTISENKRRKPTGDTANWPSRLPPAKPWTTRKPSPFLPPPGEPRMNSKGRSAGWPRIAEIEPQLVGSEALLTEWHRFQNENSAKLETLKAARDEAEEAIAMNVRRLRNEILGVQQKTGAMNELRQTPQTANPAPTDLTKPRVVHQP